MSVIYLYDSNFILKELRLTKSDKQIHFLQSIHSLKLL